MIGEVENIRRLDVRSDGRGLITAPMMARGQPTAAPLSDSNTYQTSTD
jgi:hypothetical protein